MEKTVKEGRTDDEYYCYNRFGKSKVVFVGAMNNVLQAKRKFENGENIRQMIDISVEPFPEIKKRRKAE
jgi:hypothetical protein